MPTNDNDMEPLVPASRSPDPNGHAALILVESLIHGLVARDLLTVPDALEIVTAAVNVQAEYIVEPGMDHGPMQRSGVLLALIADSLKTDL